MPIVYFINRHPMLLKAEEGTNVHEHFAADREKRARENTKCYIHKPSVHYVLHRYQSSIQALKDVEGAN